MDLHERGIIEKTLREVLDRDAGLAASLEASLRRAAERSTDELDPRLANALAWPRTLDEYLDYLTDFSRWIPRESSAPAWAGREGAQEISDRLAHFFWLVDQSEPDSEPGPAEGSPEFREWLTTYAQSWGSYLDTPGSFDQVVLDSFLQDAPQYTVGESMVADRPNMPSGWQTFNQFFARELNPGLRPIADAGSNQVLTSPAD